MGCALPEVERRIIGQRIDPTRVQVCPIQFEHADGTINLGFRYGFEGAGHHHRFWRSSDLCVGVRRGGTFLRVTACCREKEQPGDYASLGAWEKYFVHANPIVRESP